MAAQISWYLVGGWTVSDFRQLSGTVWASPQISLADVAQAARDGVTLIVNNRPENESADQTTGSDIAAAAAQAGIAYLAIPVTHGGFSREQVTAMQKALATTDGAVLAYCRSGTRSTLLWALAQAASGVDPTEIAQAAAAAGYDISTIRALIDQLHAEALG